MFHNVKKIDEMSRYLGWLIGKLTLILSVFSKTEGGRVPRGCIQSSDHLDVSCTSANLTNIPIMLNPRIHHLSMRENRLTGVLHGALSSYVELRTLDFSHNDISTDGLKGQFSKLSKLKLLNLSINALASLEEDLFSNLISLEMLDLNRNALRRIQANSFGKWAGSLQTLNLSNNMIETIESAAFDKLTNLKQLILSLNAITVFQINSSLPHLTVLDLNYNYVEVLGENAFSKMPSLKRLHLIGNEIVTISELAFGPTHSLSELLLDDNELLSVPTLVFPSLTDLTTLSLSRNPLIQLETSCFEGLSSLTTLIVTRCEMLKRVGMNAFSGLYALNTLWLSNNPILSDIDPFAFEINPDAASHLAHLYLNNNNLSTLPQQLIRWDQLESLDLSHNPWVCDCRLEWLVNEFQAKQPQNPELAALKLVSPQEPSAPTDDLSMPKTTGDTQILNSLSRAKCNSPPTLKDVALSNLTLSSLAMDGFDRCSAAQNILFLDPKTLAAVAGAITALVFICIAICIILCCWRKQFAGAKYANGNGANKSLKDCIYDVSDDEDDETADDTANVSFEAKGFRKISQKRSQPSHGNKNIRHVSNSAQDEKLIKPGQHCGLRNSHVRVSKCSYLSDAEDRLQNPDYEDPRKCSVFLNYQEGARLKDSQCFDKVEEPIYEAYNHDHDKQQHPMISHQHELQLPNCQRNYLQHCPTAPTTCSAAQTNGQANGQCQPKCGTSKCSNRPGHSGSHTVKRCYQTTSCMGWTNSPERQSFLSTSDGSGSGGSGSSAGYYPSTASNYVSFGENRCQMDPARAKRHSAVAESSDMASQLETDNSVPITEL